MKFSLYSAIIAGLCILGLPAASNAENISSVSQPPQSIGLSGTSSNSTSVLSGAIPSPGIPKWAKQTIEVAACTTPPVLDGNLDDPCWATATHHAGFYPVGSVAPVDPAEQTEVWVCADKTRLYIAFHCIHRQQSDIRAKETMRDVDLSHDDFVGVDIDSRNAHYEFSTLQVSARGTQWDRFETGTPYNIASVGDWKSAVQRVPDGWTAEISIPFPLLRYPKGTNKFGIDFYRNVSHNSTIQCWPYLPPDGATDMTEGQYLSTFTGISPTYAPRPMFSPYALTSAGDGSGGRQGMDVKYPLTATLAAFGTIRPDFQNEVLGLPSLDFSYHEKTIAETRPFFANSPGVLPDTELFYTPRIGQIDGGLRLVDQHGNMKFGLLDTAMTTLTRQSVTAIQGAHDFNALSSVEFGFVRDQETNALSNTAAMMEGIYGWKAKETEYSLETQHFPSWLGGQNKDSKDVLTFSNTPKDGHPGFMVEHSDIGPDFISRLGYVPETDVKGFNFNVSQSNQFNHGWMQDYIVIARLNSYQHHTGGFFHDSASVTATADGRSGLSYSLSYYEGRRNELDFGGVPGLSKFHDNVTTAAADWGQKTPGQQGGIRESLGNQASQAYNYLSVYQNISVTHFINFNLNYETLKLGNTITSQTIPSIGYRLSNLETLGGRVVIRGGGTDVFFEYSRRLRSGDEFNLIFGDPNSLQTHNMITAKITQVL